MVDLVKIRKKAKKNEEEAKSADASAASVALQQPENARVPEPPPVAPSPPRETKKSPKDVAAAAVESSESAVEEATAPEAASAEISSKLAKFKEQAGRRRATSDTSAVVEQAGADRIELLTFVIAGEHYAVDIEQIVEIVTPRNITRVPNSDEGIVGIISLRGTIVTLVDARRRLKHPPAGEPTDETRIVVIDLKNEMIGFVVDRVLRVIKTVAGEIESHPVVHNNELDESIRGVFKTSAALTILLDLDKLLESRAVEGVRA